MRILHCVENYFPSTGGMQEVVRQLSERLVAMGHEVTVATSAHPGRNFEVHKGVKIIGFNISGNIVNGIKGEKERYEEFLLNGNFDVTTFFAAQQWATDIALPILSRIKGKKVSVPTGYSAINLPAFSSYYDNMKKWILGYDMNVFLSHDYQDINFAKQAGVTKLCVIPNGAAADEFMPETKLDVRTALGLTKECFLVLHVGTFTGFKGQKEAAEIFFRSRIKNSALLLIGDNAENFSLFRRFRIALFLRFIYARVFRKQRLIYKFFPRDFTVAGYKQADLFLFPSNIECSPIVLFECAAAGLPFLATDVGNSAEISKWTNGGLILPTLKSSSGLSHADISASATILENLYKDSNLRKELSEKSFHAWKERFSWEIISSEYEKMYRSLTGK
jgi:L-malate glycosyltransferase